MDNVFKEIRIERKRQDHQWGGPTHDDEHFEENWENWIIDFAKGDRGPSSHRDRMIRIAALAVAAIQSNDRINGN